MFCHVARKCYICPLSINQSMKGKGPSILDLDTKLKCNLYYLVCMSIIKLGEFKYFLIPSTFVGLKKLNFGCIFLFLLYFLSNSSKHFKETICLSHFTALQCCYKIRHRFLLNVLCVLAHQIYKFIIHDFKQFWAALIKNVATLMDH